MGIVVASDTIGQKAQKALDVTSLLRWLATVHGTAPGAPQATSDHLLGLVLIPSK